MLKMKQVLLFLGFLSVLLSIGLVEGDLLPPLRPDYEQCQVLEYGERFDCYPELGVNQELCEARGCCWIPNDAPPNGGPVNVPYCLYPPNYPTYNYLNVSLNDDGFTIFFYRNYSTGYPDDVEVIALEAIFETETRLRVKISDPTNNRFETPYPKIAPQNSTINISDASYLFSIEDGNSGFRVIRKSDNTTIFDTKGINNFIFSNQFIQFGVKLPSPYIYGIGEHRSSFLLSTEWSRVTLFNHDAPPDINRNLYGSHPFYLVMEESGTSHGVFLKNSNPMEVVIQPAPAITFRTIGGILDFYIFLGPSPSDVIAQYTDLIGRPYLPPYWSLGFHLCRYGYNTLENTRNTMQRNIDSGLPLDTQWTDLDYMDNNNDFTYDHDRFSGLPEFVRELHENGMHYIPLIDPGVSGSEPQGTYPPFDLGVDLNVFVKDSSDRIFFGKVWNSVSTVWPDFTNPNATEYWTTMLRNFHDELEFDGAWIDMNEPSNFLDGSQDGCPESELENPPFVPGVEGGVLRFRTVCMTAKQYAGLHYDVHNLFGISEAEVTNAALSTILNKRPVVISRSSFAGHGRYSGHWSGDIASNWNDMRYTIPELLSFSLFGIPLMGADICGFNGDTTEPLCNRWSQLGAFYPFSRNHNTIDAREQDPASLGDQVVASAVKALRVRYSLLPYLYTLFWRAHTNGYTVARPLFFEFPADRNTYGADTSFLWGPALLVVPVLEENALEVSTYLPQGVWYDYYTQEALTGAGESVTLSAPLDTIPLLIRGGYILPQQAPEQTTTKSRLNKLELLCATDERGTAVGEIYWDDGDSLDFDEDGKNSFILLAVLANTLTNYNLTAGYEDLPHLGKITVLGVIDEVTSVTVNNAPQDFTYNPTSKILIIDDLDVDLNDILYIIWG